MDRKSDALTPDELMTVRCPHGHDRRVTWCVWCEDPARMTAAAPLGPTPVVIATPGATFSGEASTLDEASRPRELLTFRRIIQIATTRVENTSSTQCHWLVYALCDDGTLWEKPGDCMWSLVDTTEITTRRIQR